MLVLFAILLFVYNFTATLYLLTGVESLPTVDFLYFVGFACGTVWWLRSETRKSAVTNVYCHGLLMNIGWFVIIPYHLLKTRGWKGLVPVFALVASYIGSVMLAAIIYVLFFAGPTV
jgi:hypothetical protein